MRRRRIPETPMIQITSMLDMFTIILVFLLNFLDPTAAPQDGISLPRSQSSAEIPSGVVLTVTLQEIRVADRRIATLGADAILPPDVDLAAELSGFVPTSNVGKEATLVVQMDRAVPYGLVSDVLRAAGSAGFSQFRFVVLHAAG